MIQKVVVAGGGVLGSQIAFQSAFKGKDVTVWLRSPASIERARPKFERLQAVYLSTLEALRPLCGSESAYPRGLVDGLRDLRTEEIDALQARVQKAAESIRFELDLERAVRDADLIVESVAEDPRSKQAFYESLQLFLKEDAIVATNSSTMLPSAFAEGMRDPSRYLALHFANSIWQNNTAEVMGHAKTDPAVFAQVSDFARSIGMIPLELKKEQLGYILNSMLVPFLMAAQSLLVNDVADAETIDKTWVLGTGAPYGPFRILDVVGLDTAYNITKAIPGTEKIAAMLKEKIDEGKTGVQAGEGFYKYE